MWDISLDCHIGKYRGVIRSKIDFFRISNISVPCPHSQLRGRTIIKKLWTFFRPWVRYRSLSPPCWIFRVKQIHPSTASGRTTRQVAPRAAFLCFDQTPSQVFVFRYCQPAAHGVVRSGQDIVQKVSIIRPHGVILCLSS